MILNIYLIASLVVTLLFAIAFPIPENPVTPDTRPMWSRITSKIVAVNFLIAFFLMCYNYWQ